MATWKVYFSHPQNRAFAEVVADTVELKEDWLVFSRLVADEVDESGGRTSKDPLIVARYRAHEVQGTELVETPAQEFKSG